MNSIKVVSRFIKFVIPVILFLVYFFYWDTKHNVDGLWIYCGWLTLLFWQIFSAKLNQTNESIKIEKRIQILEEIVLGKVDEELNERGMRKGKLSGGLTNRMNELESKII